MSYLKAPTKGIGCWSYLHTTAKVFGIPYAQSSYFIEGSPFSLIHLSHVIAVIRLSKKFLFMQFIFKRSLDQS
jgi:hypothetical protein